jgi:hypothetical protein
MFLNIFFRNSAIYFASEKFLYGKFWHLCSLIESAAILLKNIVILER